MQKSLNDLTRSDVYLTQGPKRLKNDEKPVVLLCFRSTMLTNHWFYGVFAQKTQNIEKPLVLLHFSSKNQKNDVFFVYFGSIGV